MRGFRESRRLLITLFGRMLAYGFRLYAATWRVHGRDRFLEQLNAHRHESLLIGFWHGRYLPLFVSLRGIPAHVLVAEGFRGEIISVVSAAFGFVPVKLPRGDREMAVTRIRAAIGPQLPCASALDGALGPSRRVKPALLRIASEKGATILPISVVSRPRIVLSWRWDRREVPLPFASIEIRTGPAITIPRIRSGEDVDEMRLHIGSTLDDLEGTTKRAHPALLRPSPPWHAECKTASNTA